MLPIGGYCAMEGEDEQTGDPRAFAIQPWWKKLVILAAGSFMNFLLGAVIILLLYTGVSAVRAPVITELVDGFSQSGEAGLMEGDRIVSIDGHKILMYSDVITFLSRNDGTGMDITVRRNGETVVLKNLPMERFEYEYEGETHTGFGLVFGSVDTLNAWGRVKASAAQTVDFVRLVWLSLCDLLAGQVGISEMSGVIGIVDTVSDVGAASESVLDGLMNVLYFVAFISVNLAVMNMLPIPALDGGRIFFVVINGIVYLFSRKNIPAKYEGYVHTAGFALLLMLMIVVAFHDVWNIIFA
jgi:regulator of sigma E protease